MQHSGGISADTEQRAIHERQQSGVANQQVEPDREDDLHQHHVADEQRVAVRHQWQQRREQKAHRGEAR